MKCADCVLLSGWQYSAASNDPAETNAPTKKGLPLCARARTNECTTSLVQAWCALHMYASNENHAVARCLILYIQYVAPTWTSNGLRTPSPYQSLLRVTTLLILPSPLSLLLRCDIFFCVLHTITGRTRRPPGRERRERGAPSIGRGGGVIWPRHVGPWRRGGRGGDRLRRRVGVEQVFERNEAAGGPLHGGGDGGRQPGDGAGPLRPGVRTLMDRLLSRVVVCSPDCPVV